MRPPSLLAAILAAGMAGAPAPALTADADALETAADGERISIAGTVKAVVGSGFMLGYDGSDITVEMNIHDLSEGEALVVGDQVTVNGRVDDDFYDRRTIEAGSVYVDRLDTYFHADPVDEERAYDAFPASSTTHARDGKWVAMTGTVTGKQADKLILDTGPRTISVDTSALPDVAHIDTGDRVTVYGDMDDADLFRGREMIATSVTRLSPG